MVTRALNRHWLRRYIQIHGGGVAADPIGKMLFDAFDRDHYAHQRQ